MFHCTIWNQKTDESLNFKVATKEELNQRVVETWPNDNIKVVYYFRLQLPSHTADIGGETFYRGSKRPISRTSSGVIEAV